MKKFSTFVAIGMLLFLGGCSFGKKDAPQPLTKDSQELDAQGLEPQKFIPLVPDDSQEIANFPEWVTRLGIEKPEELKIDLGSSRITSFEKEGFDSLYLVYQGDFDKAVKEADKIAKSANLIETELSPRKVKEKNPNFSLSGVMFVNKDEGDIEIWLSVDPNGVLELDVKNMKQMGMKLEGDLSRPAQSPASVEEKK